VHHACDTAASNPMIMIDTYTSMHAMMIAGVCDHPVVWWVSEPWFLAVAAWAKRGPMAGCCLTTRSVTGPLFIQTQHTRYKYHVGRARGCVKSMAMGPPLHFVRLRTHHTQTGGGRKTQKCTLTPPRHVHGLPPPLYPLYIVPLYMLIGCIHDGSRGHRYHLSCGCGNLVTSACNREMT
jgi:hypothetical protein